VRLLSGEYPIGPRRVRRNIVLDRVHNATLSRGRPGLHWCGKTRWCLTGRGEMFRNGSRGSKGQPDLNTAAQVLALAQQTADTAIADAQREAERIIAQARERAEEIIAEAEARAQQM
jgi:hypothetical protein